MNFNDQDRQCCVTLSAVSRSPELAKGKGLARWAERCFAALILRCAQHDRSGFDC